VEEAFAFVKIMRIYSTLRHYTMLLGVCCHFKDVEGEATDLEEVVYVVVGVCIGKASNLGFCIAGGLRVQSRLHVLHYACVCLFQSWEGGPSLSGVNARNFFYRALVWSNLTETGRRVNVVGEKNFSL
jgi:hypothetical protein